MLQLLDVPPPQREHPIRVPIRHHVRGAVESRQQASRRRDVRPGERARRDQAGECVLLAEAAHLNDVLHRVGRPLGDDAKSILAPDDRPHPQIDPRSELLVDPHLLTTGAVTERQRAVVEEAERQRLLDLVSALAGHEHPRRVGLMHGDPRRSWIHRGRGERLQQGWIAALLAGRGRFEPWMTWASLSSSAGASTRHIVLAGRQTVVRETPHPRSGRYGCRAARLPSPQGMWETRSAVRWDLRMPSRPSARGCCAGTPWDGREEGKCHLRSRRASERDHLLDRLQNLRAILPVFAQELASARRQAADFGSRTPASQSGCVSYSARRPSSSEAGRDTALPHRAILWHASPQTHRGPHEARRWRAWHLLVR